MSTNKLLLFTAALFWTLQSFAQTGVAINASGNEPDNSAMLDVSSTEKGILIPRMTSGQRTGISSPATGLLVFQTDGSAGFYYYTGTQWAYLQNFWVQSGNDIAYSAGKVGIGAEMPEQMGTAPLNVQGGILYKGGQSGADTPGLLYYDQSTGNGVFKYRDNTGAEQVLGTGSISYSGLLWSLINSDYFANTDVITTGSLGIGYDIVAGESFGFATMILKENNLRIKFDDTSITEGFPANDWQLVANESIGGGANYFAIEDLTGTKVPFKVIAGAPTNSFYLASNGFLGMGTSSPVRSIHIVQGDSPTVRLDQNTLGGYPAQTWDVGGNDANFFVRDVTAGSTMPFRIKPGAPTNSVYISEEGNVGIGTSTPARKLHVSDVMRLEPTTTPASPAKGDIYFDATSNKARCYDGTEWHDLW